MTMDRLQWRHPSKCGNILLATFLLFVVCMAASGVSAQTSVWRISNGQNTVYLGGVVDMPQAADYPFPYAFTHAYEEADELYFEVDPKSLLRGGNSVPIESEFFGVMSTEKFFLTFNRFLCSWSADSTEQEREVPKVRITREGADTIKVSKCLASPVLIRADNVIESVEQRLRYNDGRTLETVLSENVYAALAEFANGVEVPLENIQDARPGLLVRIFKDTLRERAGVTGQSTDTYFRSLAQEDRKPVGGLGTAYERVHDLIYLAEGDEDAFVSELVGELLSMDMVLQHHEEIVSSWILGRPANLSGVHPIMDDATVRRRNLRWLPRVEAMFEDADTEYVLVGMEHIFHDGHGLLELLQERGYTVEQL